MLLITADSKWIHPHFSLYIKEPIINDILKNEYYVSLFDTTPDTAHKEWFSKVDTWTLILSRL